MNLENDNFGFARFVHDNIAFFERLVEEKPFIIYGEWAGTGIQKSIAVSQVGKKFYPFVKYYPETDHMVYDFVLPKHDDIVVLGNYLTDLEFDFTDRASLQANIEHINEIVEAIDACDPFIKEMFGIEGNGEGLVFYPHVEGIGRELFGELAFKAKGESHKVNDNSSKKSIQIDPNVLAAKEEFIKTYVTEGRLEQGLHEACNGEFDIKMIGNFIKWVSNDILKESVADREANNIDWKTVNKYTNAAVAQWYKNKCMEI